MKEGGLLRIKRFVDFEFVVDEILEGEENQNEAQTNELGKTFRSSHQENKVANGMIGAMIGRTTAVVKEGSTVLFEKGQEVKVSAGCLTHELLLDGGVPAMQTVWQPSPEELGILMRGGRLHLTIMGRVHPPVALEVHERPIPEGNRYVTTSNGMSGHYAVIVVDTPDGPDVDQTGTGRYETQAEAEEEANLISQMLSLPFRRAK